MIIEPGRIYLECHLQRYNVPFEPGSTPRHQPKLLLTNDAAWMHDPCVVSFPVPADEFPGPEDVLERYNNRSKLFLSVNISQLTDRDVHYLMRGMIAYIYHPAVMVDMFKEPRTYRYLLGGKGGKFMSPISTLSKDLPVWYSYPVPCMIGKIEIFKSYYMEDPNRERLKGLVSKRSFNSYERFEHHSITPAQAAALVATMNG